MIIVEGMDNTGKSTLFLRLSKDLKLLAINNQKRPQSINETALYLEGVLRLASNFPVIVDRWQAISEPIYGPICRNHHLYAKTNLEAQLRFLIQAANPLIIHCRPPDSVILNFGDSNQMDGVIKHAKELLKTYDNYMGNLVAMGFRVMNYDWTTEPYENLRAAVMSDLVWDQIQRDH